MYQGPFGVVPAGPREVAEWALRGGHRAVSRGPWAESLDSPGPPAVAQVAHVGRPCATAGGPGESSDSAQGPRETALWPPCKAHSVTSLGPVETTPYGPWDML